LLLRFVLESGFLMHMSGAVTCICGGLGEWPVEATLNIAAPASDTARSVSQPADSGAVKLNISLSNP
jgi:hypothetical protein